MTIELTNFNVGVVSPVVKALTNANMRLFNNLNKTMKVVTGSVITLILSVVFLRNKVFESRIPLKFEA